MQDHDKTQDQLIDELNEMRRKVVEFDSVQKSLNENESRYRQIVDKTNEAIFVIQDGWIKFANEKTSEITGYSMEEVLACAAVAPFVHPDDREMVAQYHASRLQGDETHYRYAFRVVRKDGNAQWVEMNSSLIVWGGRPAALCLMGDITDRKRREEALVKIGRFFPNVFRNIPDGIIVLDKDMNIMMTNQTMKRRYAHALPITGKKCFEVFRGAGQPCQVCPTIQTMKTGELAVEVLPMTRDGGIRIGWNELSSFPLTDAATGEITGGIQFVRDITERKHMEESLKETNVFLNALLDAIPLPIFYKNKDSRFVGFNKPFEEFFGKTRQELVGKSVFDIYPEDSAEVYHAKDLELFHNPGVQVYDTQLKDAHGVVHDVVFHKSTFSDSQGHVQGLIGVILDITERKRAEEALTESNKR